MKRHALTIIVGALLVAATLMPRLPGSTARSPLYNSPTALALSPDGKALYVADHTADSLVTMDAATGAISGKVTVREANGVVVAPDGKAVYATSGLTDQVLKLDPGGKHVAASVTVGRQPVGLALSADGKTLYCCNQFTDDVSIIDTTKMTRTGRFRAIREPRFCALGQGGKTLVIANQLPFGSDMDDNLGAAVSLVDLASGQTTEVQLARGASDVGQVVCSADGKFAYVPHILARWLVPPTQIERGWISTNALTIVDLEAKKRVNTVLLDDLDRGAANPWAIALSPKGDTLYVTFAGLNEVQIVDIAKLHKLVNEWPADAPSALEDDLTAVYRAGVRQRVQSGGIGPRAVVATDSGALVANYFSGTVTRLQAADGKVVQTVSLGKQPEMDPVRKGEMLFHDARICFQGWQSCSSCHPDARTDALAWDLLNDGLGNPKNAKSMLLASKTPPMMWLGVREDMTTAIVAGFKFILFHVPQGDEVACVGAYLDALKPARSPLRKADGALSSAAQHGKAIFERADVGCAKCHPAPLFTDLKSYDVGTQGKYDGDAKAFVTPTLVEVFRTAPYLHDGSAATMHEVLKERNAGDKHGKTSQLSDKELHDLIEYVMSL